MNRPRLSRALKITWTAFWGIACVLMICLWVRSYWRTDIIRVRWGLFEYDNIAASGEIGMAVSDARYWRSRANILVSSSPTMYSWEPDRAHPYVNLLGFHLRHYMLPGGAADTFEVPLWLAALTTGIAGSLPWLPWSSRFSLRTLLLAITLVAVGLGTVAWLSR
jgi:hypothetical protein